MVLQQLLEEVLADAAVTVALGSAGGSVSCDGLLPVVQQCLDKSPRYQQALETITDRKIEGAVADARRVDQLKTAALTAFRISDYATALTHYSGALRWLDETTEVGRSTAATLYSNTALCLLKVSPARPLEALQQASAAVEADPHSHKALYRRASAYHALGLSREAEQELLACLQLLNPAPGTPGPPGVEQDRLAVDHLLQQVRTAMAAQQHSDTVAGQRPSAAHSSTPRSITQSAPPAQAHSVHSAHSTVSAGTAQPGASGMQPYLSVVSKGYLDVGHTVEAGRQLQAVQDIPAGTDVLEEHPAASMVLKAHRGARCWHCARPFPAGVAGVPAVTVYCKKCPMVQYCSVACRNADPYHRPGGVECGVAWARVLPESAVLACRLARATAAAHHNRSMSSAAGRAPLPHTSPQTPLLESLHLAQQQQQQQATQDSPPSSTLDKSLLQDLVSLMQVPRAAPVAAERCVLATLCGDILHRMQDCAPGDPLPTVQDILVCLLRVDLNGVALRPPITLSTPSGMSPSGTPGAATASSSAHSAGPAAMGAAEDTTGCYALAVYPAVSCANHDCNPNMMLRFQEGTTVVGRITRPVRLGDPVTISYGPQIGQHLTPHRQARLQQLYHFVCRCRSCVSPSEQEALWGHRRCALACTQPGCPGAWVAGAEDRGLWQLCHTPVQQEPLNPACGSDAVRAGVEGGVQSVLQGLGCEVCCWPDPSVVCVGEACRCDVCGHRLTEGELDEAASRLREAHGMVERAEGLSSLGRDVNVAQQAVDLYLGALRGYQEVLHVGNVRLGQVAHDAAQVCGKALRLHGAARQSGALHGQEQLAALGRSEVMLYEVSCHVLSLHYPAASVQVAHEQLLLAEAMARLAGVRQGGGAVRMASRAGWLRKTAICTLLLYTSGT